MRWTEVRVRWHIITVPFPIGNRCKLALIITLGFVVRELPAHVFGMNLCIIT